jgi:cytochrome c biogenesis protein CcdA
MKARIALLLLLLIFSAAAPWASAQQPSPTPQVTVFYNSPCRDCVEYIDGTLLPVLKEFGFQSVDERDFINDRANRAELNQRSTDLGVPIPLQAHLATFIDDRVILEGHVPPEMIRALLSLHQPPYEKILIYQDRMPEMGQTVTSYKIWAFRGPVKEYPIATPISEYLTWFAANRDSLSAAKDPAEGSWGIKELLPLVLSSGLLDGINPCAFAVLLFFIAFMFTLQRARSEMLLMGGVYITMIYLAYFGIGLGLMGAIVISGTPHLMALIGSWLLIALGLVNVKDYFWYGRWFTLSVPAIGHEKAHQWLKRATLPATAVAGFLVGLCTFPCSGAIYVAVLGLLSVKTTYWTGFAYLVLYNIMFVLPLIILLLALGNRRTMGTLSRWEAQNKRALKLATGLVMVVLGGTILLWFV